MKFTQTKDREIMEMTGWAFQNGKVDEPLPPVRLTYTLTDKQSAFLEGKASFLPKVDENIWQRNICSKACLVGKRKYFFRWNSHKIRCFTNSETYLSLGRQCPILCHSRNRFCITSQIRKLKTNKIWSVEVTPEDVPSGSCAFSKFKRSE